VAEESTPAHTPGPWSWCDCPGNCGHIGSASDHLATVTFGGWGNTYPAMRPIDGSIISGQYEVYMETDYFGDVPIEQAKANARLIASAPDLLTALQALAADYAWSAGHRNGGYADEHPLTKAFAAIAKATEPA
jgi:hypothetical protein